jgi:hypothetical protein
VTKHPPDPSLNPARQRLAKAIAALDRARAEYFDLRIRLVQLTGRA